MKTIENPIETLVVVGKENSELHEEVQRLFREVDWYRNALTTITAIPGIASEVATKALQHRPFKS